MANRQDTIYALSSGSLPSGVAVIRLSGPLSRMAIEALCGEVPEPRRAALRWIRDRDGNAIDQGIVLFFPDPASFTGEDCAELQVHGGRASVAALLAVLADFDGLRLADAGEFSRRAFDNGKLDLVEIEGLADLIAAETEMQRRLAVEQSNGHLSGIFQSWMRELTHCRALIEAELDFPEEDDVPGSVSGQVWEKVRLIAEDIEVHLKKHRSVEIVRDGFKIVIAGRPNAGKSSLLNALAKREVAIVTEIEGTTRDLISVDLDIAGYLVRLTDTAGMRVTEDVVEQVGVKRALRSVEEADLVLLLRDVNDTVGYPEIDSQADVLKVLTKVDTRAALRLGYDEIGISSVDGSGIDSLTKRIADILAKSVNFTGEATAVRTRQVQLLQQVCVVLKQNTIFTDRSLELRAEDLRQASHLLGKITGFVDVEDLLDVIFSEFCIGK